MNKILIANRGEIAVRIIRACKEMNIKTVAVYSTADKDALHTKLADESICIGPANSKQSYLNIKNIIEAANITKADSIHPGFGFLSENSNFAKICEESNIKFIGPKSNVIELLGNKANSKELMKKEGVPVIPGSDGPVKDLKDAILICEKIGYPVLLKASSGGGGKGIRLCNSFEDLETNYNLVKQEAKNAFNDDEIYIEKFIKNPRHIEIQILADEYGNIVHLGERDCSIQRNHQKIIEETPSTIVDEKLRSKMGNIAIKAARAAGYTSCGTIEFLVDSDKNFYFMEMNTRIQVEHPVTEMRTGIDIVKEQIKIAAGEKLKFKQKEIEYKGHSIECRINSENPNKNFMPCPGKINGINLPGGNGIRIDSAIYSGYTIPPYYDSMIAKIIVHGNSRNEAISKMKRALEELVIDGVETNRDFLFDIIRKPNFIRGDFDTSFIEKEMNKAKEQGKTKIDGKVVFKLYDTYGFPPEVTSELAQENNMTVDMKEFDELFKAHQEKSRMGSEQKFKGGLAEQNDTTIAYHTATHLLNAALKVVLGPETHQRGSNITVDRMRFDFNCDHKMTDEEKKQTEDLVNKWIQDAIPVTVEEMKKDEAVKSGAECMFIEKYPDVVTVYTIGNVSKELCGGPHVKNTSELGKFKIKKEEASSAGVRRIKAILEK